MTVVGRPEETLGHRLPIYGKFQQREGMACGEGHDHVGEDVYSTNQQKATTHIDKVRLAAIELVGQAAIPGTLASLARLNVFEALARAGDGVELTPQELGNQAMPGKVINLSYLGRMLRLASSVKVLREVATMSEDGSTEHRYGLEPIGKFLVDDAEKGSLVHLLLMYQDPVFLSTWNHLPESVLDDSVQPFARAHGGLHAWEYGMQNPEFDEKFNKAMAGHSKLYMRAFLDVYQGFEGVRVLIDVGGGFGSAISTITARYPHIKGINFDQPHVIKACPELPGVEHMSGDMFESIPSGGDAIFLKYILHDWDDESCIKLLKNCHKVLPANGKVIAVDSVLTDTINFEGGDRMAFMVDMNMMAFNHSGARERNEGEMRKLGLYAGFLRVDVVCKVDQLSVTEFIKA
ncbi:caffeic acid 3-O-methyltransferase isoform X2 [Physcomitrium patens]|uniref:O-methyltransferase domain-containing protein n=1 Tax=Physcomitrium patens TaxID=3218 RepID=A0A7I4AJ62_PHYPA|nr:caffeic acid 3-O-methyltransferase-like isoform X2 [Physcomitrium patens]|eukprot:XP_024390981.1 caffeic acid 3-O-methyltransferase-like isoform X2 [Physcomitrella patens]